MSLVSNGMSPADIAAVAGNGTGFGNDGGAWWLIVLFLFAAMGGWGNNNGYGRNDGNGSGSVQQGFDQAAVMSGLNDLMQTANANQMGLMTQLSTLASQQQNCCCENRLATSDLRYSIATEASADRVATANGVRDIIANQTANTQAILDKLCQQEIDALKTQNANLQTQINMANLAASQSAQTARILADNAAQTTALEQYLNPAPIPAYMVQNPNCCPQNFGCGCGSFA